jgi:DNA-binding transcriptional LysR family regulator
MDRLVSITAFVRVAENGGFSAAARSLNVSPTNGQRSGPGAGNRAWRASAEPHHSAHVSLTEVGREYYERCSQILHELQEGDEVAVLLILAL